MVILASSDNREKIFLKILYENNELTGNLFKNSHDLISVDSFKNSKNNDFGMHSCFLLNLHRI